MNKTKKRLAKIRGIFNLSLSFATLKYSKRNQKYLAKRISEIKLNKLHVGCGNILLDDWLNITFDPKEIYGVIENRANKHLLNINITKGFPCSSDSIDTIAAAHFIEHIDLNDCIKFCSEAFRVLRKGGVIRLSCPDLEIYARNYVNGNMGFYKNEEITRACTFKSATTPGQIFAAKAYDSGGAHKWFHDFSSLEKVLSESGFYKVKKCTRLQSTIPEVGKFELPGREIETLYVEAIK